MLKKSYDVIISDIVKAIICRGVLSTPSPRSGYAQRAYSIRPYDSTLSSMTQVFQQVPTGWYSLSLEGEGEGERSR